MASTLAILGSLVSVYCVSLAWRLLVNLHHVRKLGIPYIIIPLNQNAFIWMIVSVPLRPWLVKHAPSWVFDRLSLTIYGFEFHEGMRAFEQYASPQGNDKSYAIVTLGKIEIHTRDPEIVAEVLHRPNDFGAMKETELFMSKFGPNVFTSAGPSWVRQRKVVASVINERISKTVFEESMQQTQGLLDEVVGAGEAGETTRVFDMMKKITINVLSGAGMGASVDWNNIEEKPVAPYKQTYMEAMNHIIAAFAGTILLPTWFMLNYPSFLPGHDFLRSIGTAIQEFPLHTRMKLEEERHQTLAAHGKPRGNIMSQLLHASEQEDDGAAAKGGPTLSEQEVVSNLFVFTAAGFDTTVNTLSYGLTTLCRHPEWQEWLFEEIDSIMPASDGTSTPPDYTAIFPKALRVQACMHEILRLFPPLIHMAKTNKRPQQIHTSKISLKLPANSTVYANNVGVHIDPEVWRNLNLHEGETASEKDELVFRPTRWLVPTGSSSSAHSQFFKPPKGSYVPWSMGPRVCPGQKMALVEFTAIFLELFRAHRIEAVALEKKDGKVETSDEMNRRLEDRMRDSFPILTLQMRDVYGVAENDKRGLNLRLLKRL